MDELGLLTAAAKAWLIGHLGLGRDGAHVQLGMMVFVGWALVTRGRWLRAGVLALLAIELANEIIDMEWHRPASTAFASGKDVVTTMIGPLLLWMAIGVERRSKGAPSGEDGEHTFE